MANNKGMKIVIVGSGTFGCSTALHLARKGYTNVTCSDKYPFPSPISAGNDINKIIDLVDDPNGPSGSDERLQREAVKAWRNDPTFKDFYHEVGVIAAAVSDQPLQGEKELSERRRKHGWSELEYLDTPEDFKKKIPALTGPLKNWRGYNIGPQGGWVHARKAMEAAAKEAQRLGVKFQVADVKKLVTAPDNTGKCIGVETAQGETISADRVILCAGANTALLTDFQGQLEAKCFTLAHIKLTEEENERLKNTPVLFNYERGFFFEGDSDNREMKICNEFPGYTNRPNNSAESIPLARHEIPLEAEKAVRDHLRDTIPELADREFVKARLCWCTDSPDRNLILTTHPDHDNVVLATGDSGRSFILLPVIGDYISSVVTQGIESLTDYDRNSWRWRPDTASQRDLKQGRWGGKGVVTDLRDVQEWTTTNWDKSGILSSSSG